MGQALVRDTDSHHYHLCMKFEYGSLIIENPESTSLCSKFVSSYFNSPRVKLIDAESDHMQLRNGTWPIGFIM